MNNKYSGHINFKCSYTSPDVHFVTSFDASATENAEKKDV